MSVRVAVRSRPLSVSEAQDGAKLVVRMDSNCVYVESPSEATNIDANVAHSSETGLANETSFQYDHALWSSSPATPCGASHAMYATQEEVYNKVGAELLDHVLDGYNGCIFAYGQTGSGKTYSMMGTHEQPGIIPRISGALFDAVGAMQGRGNVETCVEVSYHEIYNEKVRCLLRPTKGGYEDTPLRVREHPKYGPFIEGLAKFVVTEQSEFLQLMNDGNKVRVTACTAMNASSSRSHAVFTIVLSQKERVGAVVTTKTSRLNLVDLAGSERVAKTHATGRRLVEGATINKSLMCLGNVISALAESQETDRARHVPYRDSTLTWILKDNLGGNSKTVMLATISPCSLQYDETMSTLRYAERAKKIVNRAVVNEANSNEVVAALQREIMELKEQLKSASATERTALQEQIAASEAVEKDMAATVQEKLIETKLLMAEREGAMRELEGKLQAQRDEIDQLRSANAEKERLINDLLLRINSSVAMSRTQQTVDNGAMEVLRSEVAALEQEQHLTNARLHASRRASATSFDMDGTHDSSLLLGDSTATENQDDSLHSSEREFDDIELDSADEEREEEEPEAAYDRDLLLCSEDEDLNMDGRVEDALEVDDALLLLDEGEDGDSDTDRVIDVVNVTPLDLSTAATIVEPPPPVKPLGSKADGAYTQPFASMPRHAITHTKTLPQTTLEAAIVPSNNHVRLVVPSHAVPNNKFLCERFKVLQMPENGSSDLITVWRVDVLKEQFVVTGANSRPLYKLPAADLYRVGKGTRGPRSVELYFFDRVQPFTLQFATVRRCRQFYELAIMLRRGAILWCPAFCQEGDTDVIVEIQGTTIDVTNGDILHRCGNITERARVGSQATTPVNGSAQFFATAMPYEVVDLWYGCFSLCNSPLPQSTAMLASFLPANQHEVYIIGVSDIPSALVGCDELGRFLLSCVGGDSDYFVVSDMAKSSEGHYSGHSTLLIICRRPFIARISDVEVAFVKSPRGADGSPDTPHCGAIGCSLRINEASLAVIFLNSLWYSAGSLLSRSDQLADLLSTVPLGDAAVALRARFDYLIVSSVFGFGGDYCGADKDALLTHPFIHGMREAHASEALRNVAVAPLRIFYASTPKVSRFAAKSYGTSRALPGANAFVTADIFCRRPHMSLFVESPSPPLMLVVSDVAVKGMGSISHVGEQQRLCVSGNCVEGAPLQYRGTLTSTADRLEFDHCGSMTMRLCESWVELLRLQSLTLTLCSLDARTGASYSAQLPLKGLLHIGEPVSFDVALYSSLCQSSSTLVGSITCVYTAHPRRRRPVEALQEGLTVVLWCFENQCRDSLASWVPAELVPESGVATYSALDAHVKQAMEQLLLPSSQWNWTSDWDCEMDKDELPRWCYADAVGGPYSYSESPTSFVRRLSWHRTMVANNPATYHAYYSRKYKRRTLSVVESA